LKKVLITGGAGFIGFHLAKKLIKENYEVDIVDNFSRGVNDSDLINLSKNVRLIDKDLIFDNINNFDKNYSFIYHLAAVVGVNHVLKSPYDVLDKNISLLQSAIKIGKAQKKIVRFIFASTSEVYAGTLKNYDLEFPTPETTPLTVSDLSENRTSYMLSKIYGEAMCLHSGLPITIIRPHNFYGPRMGLSHVVPELMKKVVECKSTQLDVYSVNHKRTFCYITDAVNAIQMLAQSKSSIGKIYNIGSDDEEITMGELSKKIIEILGKKLAINPLPSTQGSPERRCPSIEKLRQDTEFKKQFSLDDGLKETFKWYETNIFSGREESAL
tara:strand:+ start:4853 stop:5833 length:981 start_codon:yes stop_codon:yes gene_type:complete